MVTTLGNEAITQDKDRIAVEDCTQAVSDKDAGARVVLEDLVDVLKQGLFSVCIERGGLGH